MITLKDGTILRNLEEQVLENKQQIAKHWNVDRILADFGIKMLGRFDNYDDIKDINEGENYGNAYLIGTEEPYDVYVWTRADENAGQPVPYWLDIGPISLVGPQGPQGEMGPQGETGASTKWYASNLSPSNPENYELNDQYLNTTNGNVYELDAYVSGQKYWRYTGNIRGPQGIQGIQGVQGIQGPQGEPGPQGERGDVGGFINIWGILTQSSQLPTPSSLNNMTIAYLVGTTMPYDLWIQVGENSATAIWQNTGPFNAATAVTSGGVYQNVWDADTKLDKVTASGSYQQAYVKNANGSQGMMNITTAATGSTLVQRNSTGSITLPGSTPGPQEAVNKQFCENTFVAKPTDTSGFNRIVGVNTNNTSITYKVQYPNYNYDEASAASRVGVPYMEQGQIACSIPTSDYSAANKKYVDDGFVAKPSGTGAVYAAGDGTFSVRTISGGEARPWSIVERGGNGVIYTGTPTADNHATSKAYVDNNFVAKADTTDAPTAGKVAKWGLDGKMYTNDPVNPTHCTNKQYVDNLFVQARFNFTAGSNYIIMNLYMKKSDYDTINSIETLAAYLNGKGANSAANSAIIHMGERATTTSITDILQYIYAPAATRFTIVGFARSSGASTFIESSTLTYTSKAYVSL